ncbi:hypothetical protein [Symbioplanes lichenis]|uniref:hypothetical protein n=1 Tax=Symbioplanes lichenis TaxID=1629072 RepID=UPI00273A0AE3|nr:hypothetical protein [Actinoplanes lichenis]
MTDEADSPRAEDPADRDAAVPAPEPEKEATPQRSGDSRTTSGDKAADDDDPYRTGPIAADQHRVPSGVPRALFGERYDESVLRRQPLRDEPREQPSTDNVNHGFANQGDNGTINYFAEAVQEAVIRDLPDKAHLVATYAGTSSDAPLDQRLDVRPVASLIGLPGTGRFTTACAALARRRGDGNVHEILAPAGERTGWTTRLQGKLVHGHGYVIRLAGGDHVRLVRQLSAAATECGASIVVVRDADPRDGERSGGEVHHQRPDPVEVFAQHLRAKLHTARDWDDQQITGYVKISAERAALCEVLRRTYSPKEAAAIGERFAVRTPRTDEEIAQVLATTGPEIRARAAKALISPRSDAPAPHRPGQHERAFRIAYAAFCNQPLNDVFVAAGWLLQAIDGQSRRPDLGRLALAHPVTDLLGDGLKIDWEEGAQSPTSPGASRRAWLRNVELRGAILDVAWHDFDHTRPALLAWLNRLVTDEESSPTMKTTAADVAGLLASHDYDRIRKDLIDKWAISPAHEVRQTAARAVVVAATSGQVGTRVQETLQSWVAGSGKRKHDTALRVYTNGLQLPDPRWHLADLRRISPDALQRDSELIAEAVNQLYLPENLPGLTGELARWLRSPATGADRWAHVHAARAFLALAARDAASGSSSEMQRQLGQDILATADLTLLFQYALLDARLASRGWELLGEWLDRANEGHDLRTGTARLLTSLARAEPTRRRLAFFLERIWHGRDHTVPSWITDALEER